MSSKTPRPPSFILRAAALALAWLGLAPSALAGIESYALDPVHTRLAFQISHAGFSNPVGSFSRLDGRLDFDPDDWTRARLSVRIPIDSLDLGDAKWREKILDHTFFDAKKFPEASFVSTRIEPIDASHARVTGDLTLHGVTRPVTLAVTLNALKRHPLTLKKTAGFSATASLSRKDFGIDAWTSVVGDEVRLIIEVEAVRSRDAAAAEASSSQEPADANPKQP